MSGLNENEKRFLRDFLKFMSDDSVSALAATVTRRMIKADTREACIDAIILHTLTLDEFLKRQKVTKENLFRYLNERKISVPNTDKAALEMQIKDLINGGSGQVSHSPNAQMVVKQDLLPQATVWTVAEPTCNPSPELSTLPPSQPQLPDFQMPGAAQLYVAAASATRVTVQERVTTTTYTQVSAANVFVNTPNPDPRDVAITNEFAKWFYTRVNQPGGLLPEDFWLDANLNLTVKRRNEADTKAVQGGPNVALLLNQTLEEHQLYLNPNTSSQGLWGRGNEGGLLLVLVCGTLHQRPPVHQRSASSCEVNCLGTFENLFLLAQDPCAADNWKIKTLEVILRSNPHTQQPPTIHDSELAKTIKL